MNKSRIDMVKKARILIEAAYEEEQNAFDNLPENFQNSDRGQQMELNIDSLLAAMDSLDEVLES